MTESVARPLDCFHIRLISTCLHADKCGSIKIAACHIFRHNPNIRSITEEACEINDAGHAGTSPGWSPE